MDDAIETGNVTVICCGAVFLRTWPSCVAFDVETGTWNRKPAGSPELGEAEFKLLGWTLTS